MLRAVITLLALFGIIFPSSAEPPQTAIFSFDGNWAVMMARDSQNHFECIAYTGSRIRGSLGFGLTENGVARIGVILGERLPGLGHGQFILSDLVLVLDRQRFTLRGATVEAEKVLYEFDDRDEILAFMGKLARTEFATLFDASGAGSPLGAWPTDGASSAIRSLVQSFDRIFTG